VLGEEVGEDGRPGDDFPPDEPLGVDDPSIVDQGMIARDDVEAREARRRVPDDDTDAPAPGLLGPSGDDTDREPQLVADESSATEPAAEAAAVRTVDDDAGRHD
jgi:hypothetical protein